METNHAGISSKAKLVLIFIAHQATSTIGILVAANLITAFTFDLIRWLSGRAFPLSFSQWILTGIPYFPVQICMAFITGWLLSFRLRHKSMLWVWVLPAIILGCAFVALPTVTSLEIHGRLSHFFGWGCRPEARCFDELGFTLPFYIASFYSIGALFARKLRAETLTRNLRTEQRVS